MIDFLTERETERFMEMETRCLALPEGGTQIMTAYKLIWERVDLYVQANIFTLGEMIRMTRQSMAKFNMSFDEAFRCVIAEIDHKMF